MKKLQLKLDGKEMLSKEQMKKISGGYGYVCYCPGGNGYSVFQGDDFYGILDDAMDWCGCETFDACSSMECNRIW